mmetsp:Transcript_49038/g.140948  ORF Transcript_49038/g.140948 Transcript_49038/m.140948 type:complete len:124 (-) Transcript_49038:18-389(-)
MIFRLGGRLVSSQSANTILSPDANVFNAKLCGDLLLEAVKARCPMNPEMAFGPMAQTIVMAANRKLEDVGIILLIFFCTGSTASSSSKSLFSVLGNSYRKLKLMREEEMKCNLQYRTKDNSLV